ncbi:SRPBCC family protein [Nocardioides litoris]|uniref:SRPBCC family protein n=1 Tax=Nocardioides litoris TaxID=1926648 RepID=UPI001B86E7BC|nr:SRPBCC family protein [Nocardioides litoris]
MAPAAPDAGRPWTWGATPAEAARRFPADDLAPGGHPMTRAVDVAAPPEVVWPWLCQLSQAPYSYDWVDNLGRRSPRDLTPGATDLREGQRMAGVFRLAAWEEGRSWTGVAGGGRVGATAATYAAEPAGPGRSRLLCRMTVAWPRPLALALAWGDLVMMRRQLLNLRDLAETRP